MKKIYKSIKKYSGICALSVVLSTTSCVDYLDKAPEVDLSADDVYSSFTRYQGFIEDIYQCVVDMSQSTSAEMSWNYGGDEVLCTHWSHLPSRFQDGDYWRWENNIYSIFSLNSDGKVATNDRSQGYWGSGWFGIRKANQAIGNIDKLVLATQEEQIGRAHV